MTTESQNMPTGLYWQGKKTEVERIGPPFATGADFSVKMEIGDVEWTKEPSAIEDKAYRDTWGRGLDSFLQTIYDKLVIMRELLSEKGSIYIHLDWHASHYVKIIMDDIFGKDNFRSQLQKSLFCHPERSEWSYNILSLQDSSLCLE